jgi:dihydroneopterin aldolase
MTHNILTPDIVIIRDLSLMMSVGINDFEKTKQQRVIINVEIGVEPNNGAQSDNISDVLSYADIIIDIERIAYGQHFNLVETLAEQIADSILKYPQALHARIRAEKPDVFIHAAGVGVEIFRQK